MQDFVEKVMNKFKLERALFSIMLRGVKTDKETIDVPMLVDGIAVLCIYNVTAGRFTDIEAEVSVGSSLATLKIELGVDDA